jgi:hypothetical protein
MPFSERQQKRVLEMERAAGWLDVFNTVNTFDKK